MSTSLQRQISRFLQTSFQVKVHNSYCSFRYPAVYPTGIRIGRKSVWVWFGCLESATFKINMLKTLVSICQQHHSMYSVLSAEEDTHSLRKPRLFFFGHILMMFPASFQVMAGPQALAQNSRQLGVD